MDITNYIPNTNLWRTVDSLEKYLDYVDLVPLPQVSIASGTARACLGVAKIVTRLGLASIYMIQSIFLDAADGHNKVINRRNAKYQIFGVLLGARSIARGYYVQATSVREVALNLSKIGLIIYDYSGIRSRIWDPINNTMLNWAKQ